MVRCILVITCAAPIAKIPGPIIRRFPSCSCAIEGYIRAIILWRVSREVHCRGHLCITGNRIRVIVRGFFCKTSGDVSRIYNRRSTRNARLYAHGITDAACFTNLYVFNIPGDVRATISTASRVCNSYLGLIIIIYKRCIRLILPPLIAITNCVGNRITGYICALCRIEIGRITW